MSRFGLPLTKRRKKSRIFDLLRRYHQEQKEHQVFMGDRWVETDYVFTKEDGSPIRPDTIAAWFSTFSKRKGLPHINPHAFRHTAASILVAQGTDVVTVSKMLGDAQVFTTADIYSHVIDDAKQQASNALSGRCGGSVYQHSHE